MAAVGNVTLPFGNNILETKIKAGKVLGIVQMLSQLAVGEQRIKIQDINVTTS